MLALCECYCRLITREEILYCNLNLCTVGGAGSFDVPVQCHVSSCVAVKPDSNSLTQCSIMDTSCSFADSILDSNLISQYSRERHGPHSCCANSRSTSSSSPLPSNDLISQSADVGITDPNLSFSSPDQFFNARKQMEESVHNLNYSGLPAMNSSLNAETHICSSNDSAYLDMSSVRYDFCSTSNQDQHTSVIYDVASDSGQSVNRTSSAELYTSHHCDMTSDYQSTKSGCSDLVLSVPIAVPPLLPSSCVASQQVESSDLDVDTIESGDAYVERSKVEVGIQCEVGSETLQALLDEEEEGDESLRGDDSVQEFDGHSDTQKSKLCIQGLAHSSTHLCNWIGCFGGNENNCSTKFQV